MLVKTKWGTQRAASSIRHAIIALALGGALLLPVAGSATLIADPDLLDELTYPVGSVINTAFDGLTLSVSGTPAQYYSFTGEVLRYSHLGAVVTHTLGYAYIYDQVGPAPGTADVWGQSFQGRTVLRIDLDAPANAVFADIIAFGESSDIMEIAAYDASDGHLGTVYGQDFPYGMPATRVEYSQADFTIAYFTVTNYAAVSFGFVIDKVGAVPVPEPTTALLLAGGLAGLAAAGRRRSPH
jgi:hypothetical protein